MLDEHKSLDNSQTESSNRFWSFSTYFELDAIYCQQNWNPISIDEFRARIQAITEQDCWIIDG